MFEVFTFFTDTFQAPVLCHVANVLAELLVPIDFLNFFSNFDSIILGKTDASYIQVAIEREVSKRRCGLACTRGGANTRVYMVCR